MAATEELGLEVFVEGWRQFEKLLERLDRDIDSTGRSMEKTGGIAGGAFAVALGNIAAKAAMVLVDALFKAGEAVVDFGLDSLQMAADFQGQMAILEIAASSTGLSFDQLHDAALQVGGDTKLIGVNAVDSADAMTGLFKAGLSNVEVFGDLEGYMAGTAELGGALRASIDLAAASELDMVQASDLASIALSSFGSELKTETERADFINDAMNNMVQAADASVAEVSGLAEALKMVGPTAGAAGISIEDTNNALALLSTRGIQGSMAGTALDGMLRSLRDVTPQAADTLGELGIEIFDTEGNMYSLVDIIGQFEGALGDSTEAARAAALGAIFTAQGQRSMNTLLGEGVAGWDEMAAATAEAATIQEQAAARGETFNAQMESLEGTVETLKIGIGEQFLPVAQELITWFAEMVEQHGPQLQAVFEMVSAIVVDLVRGFMSFVDVLSRTGDPLEALAEMLTYTIGEESPAMQSVWDAMDTTKAIFETVWAFVMEQVAVAVAWFQENMPLIQETGRVLVEFWQNNVVPALDNIWNIIKIIVSTAMAVVLDIIKVVMAIITGDWDLAWQTIKEIAVTILGAFLVFIENLFEVIANLIGTSMEEIRATWKSNWEMAKLAAETVWNNIVASVKQWMADLQAKILSFRESFRWLGSMLIEGMKEGILHKFGEILHAVSAAIQRITDRIREKMGIRSASLVYKQIGEQMMEGLSVGIEHIAPTIQNQIQAVVQAPALAMGGPRGAISNSVTNNFNLTTQSTTRPGGLAMEFGAMAFAGAGASR